MSTFVSLVCILVLVKVARAWFVLNERIFPMLSADMTGMLYYCDENWEIGSASPPWWIPNLSRLAIVPNPHHPEASLPRSLQSLPQPTFRPVNRELLLTHFSLLGSR